MPRWALAERLATPGCCRGLVRSQREALVAACAAADDVPLLEAALAAAGLEPSHRTLAAAAAAGALVTCRWLLAQPGRLRGPADWPATLRAAAKSGLLPLYQLCRQQCTPDWYQQPTSPGPGPGPGLGPHVALMEALLRDQSLGGGSDLTAMGPGQCAAAFEVCDLVTCQRLSERHGGLRAWALATDWAEEPAPTPAGAGIAGPGAGAGAATGAGGAGKCAGDEDWDDVEAGAGARAGKDGEKDAGDADGGLGCTLRAALRSRTPDWRAKLSWLLSQGSVLKPCHYTAAAARGPRPGPDCPSGGASLERFLWLKERGCPLAWRQDHPALWRAVACGDALAVRWLLREGVRPDQHSLRAAARRAARADHAGALAALKQAGCSLHPKELAEAAACGSGALLWLWGTFHWAMMEPDGLTPAVFTAAAASGSVEAVRWLHERGCGVFGAAAWDAAVRSGSEAMVEALAELGCPMPDDGGPLLIAAAQAEWRLLARLLDAGMPCGPTDRWLFTQCVTCGAPLRTLQALEARLGVERSDWARAEAAAEGRAGVGDGGEGEGERARVLAWVRERRGLRDQHRD
ncbi:hypothetical protein HYH03_016940 [Edaphochlamys debaryana]|uniref:Ankyrin repeat domain-containing protein n=1 Tax=Edaphochlamys debaryana TaxID=47281 RepID=A0A835XNK9_9CHLO|nr:hypothetical protein HYH03_016940 [Edaphochlamys debaryana]|eukprot:KAG2484205.1 hypothetical protein HYH03_016940 [Edaphochlamys debaryana]